MRFVTREAMKDERARVVRHLLGCADCRDLAALLARLFAHANRADKTSDG